MAGPLVYLPNHTGSDVRILRDLGADALLDKCVSPMFKGVVRGGPDGGRGALVWFDNRKYKDTNAPARVDLESQHWWPVVPDGALPAGRYWIGIERDAPPRPDCLARFDTYDGHPVQLADGNTWTIAVAQWLPHRQGLDPATGSVSRRVAPEHQLFFEQAMEYRRLFLGDGATPENMIQDATEIVRRVVVDGNAWNFALTALQKNYRVTRDLADRLGLFDDTSIFWTIAAVLGLSQIAGIEIEKKKLGPA